MASKTLFKIRNTDGELIAQTRYAEDAAALVALTGGKVTYDHSTSVWVEGGEAFSAGDSYDAAAAVMHARITAASKPYLDWLEGGRPASVTPKAMAAASKKAVADVNSADFMPTH